MKRAQKLASTVPLTALAAAALAPPVLADPPDRHPIRLIPDPEQKQKPAPGGDPTAQLTVPQRYLCSNHGTLRNVPDGFTMGWCRPGWPIDLSRASTAGYQGWAYGNYNGCGWIYATHIGSPQSGWSHNCTASTPESAFMIHKNQSPSNDGAPVTVKSGGCTAFLNTRPWAFGGATDQVTGIPAGQQVFYRYLTRNDQYVMVRRTNDATYPWVFVPKACVPQPAVVGPS